MKKLLLFLVLGAIAFGTGMAVVAHYKNYQTQKTHEARVVENEHLREIATLKTEAQINAKAYQLQLERLRAECEKGRVIYENLTASQKAKADAPVCTAN